MSELLRPKWTGIILVDEKRCMVHGGQYWMYLAVDKLGDIIHCRRVTEVNTSEAVRFLREVGTLVKNIQGVVTDLDSALTNAVKVVYPEIPYQYCIKHALAAIAESIGYAQMRSRRQVIRMSCDDQKQKERQKYYATRRRRRLHAEKGEAYDELRRVDTKAALYEQCRQILIAPTEVHARELYVRLIRSDDGTSADVKKIRRFFTRYWENLMMHHVVPELPRTTNIVENVNKQLQRRYKTVEAFQYQRTAEEYTNLLIAFLRQKKYTDCRGKRKMLNGKSRLAHAKVRGLHPDWLKNCLKIAKISNRK